LPAAHFHRNNPERLYSAKISGALWLAGFSP